jgi:hypothetical protein
MGKCPKCQEAFRVPARQGALATREAVVAVSAAAPTESGEIVLASSASHLFAKTPDNRESLREQVLGSFQGQLTPPRVSMLRKLGIVLVAVVIAVMPLFYLTAAIGLAYGMYWLTVSSLIRQLHPGLFWVGEVAGGLLLFCLLKPLFEPRRRSVEPYPLAPDKERLLTDFVAQICEQIDAGPPSAIHAECSARLAAEYRRGLLGLINRDVVLTIGLPLSASLSVEQLAALIAVQMAPHRRRAAGRVMNLIRGINGWLWRSIYEDGRFDAWLARVASRPRFSIAKLLVPLRYAKLVAQGVLFIPMFIGNTVASVLVRKTELDADRAAARLVGRENFAASVVRLGLIEFTWQGVLAELNFLHRDQQLPDSLPQQLALRMLDMTPELCTALRETVGKQEEKPFDSRPSDEERQAATRDEPAGGMLICRLPARTLFADYEPLAREMTWDYYVANFGAGLLKTALARVHLPAAAT